MTARVSGARPNGAGKTTFARSFLPKEAQLPRFINADLTAAGLAPFAPETAAIKAGRLMLEEIEHCAQRGESFAFETTLSGMGYLHHIAQWRRSGTGRSSDPARNDIVSGPTTTAGAAVGIGRADRFDRAT